MSGIDQALLDEVMDIAVDAGERILAVYRRGSDIDIDTKDDDSPLTEADLAAHAVIEQGLRDRLSGVPVLSEESGLPDWETRRGWERYWLVDPLDGTKEFINRNGEFTVNIALIDRGVAVLGVVHVPDKDVTYYGAVGIGAFRREAGGAPQAIRTRALEPHVAAGGTVTVVASRRHRGPDLEAQIARIEERFGEVDAASMGSSLKICLVAEGRADLYPRLAPTSEWDTAAAHAVLAAAGGVITDTDFKELRYNAEEDILNPFFLAIGDPDYDWRSVLAG